MNLEWIDTALSVITALISLGVGYFSVKTIRDTRNKSYQQFIEERKKRKLDEKN